jgi:hypothetical protein
MSNEWTWANYTRTQTTQKNHFYVILQFKNDEKNVLCNMYKSLFKTLPVNFLDITQILAFDHSVSAYQITCFTNSYSQLNTEDMPVD